MAMLSSEPFRELAGEPPFPVPMTISSPSVMGGVVVGPPMSQDPEVILVPSMKAAIDFGLPKV